MMKALFIIAVMLLAGCQEACAPASLALMPEVKCDCPDNLVKCMPEPASSKTLCYVRVDVRTSEGFQPGWVPTYCHPKCVDGDLVMIPDCE